MNNDWVFDIKDKEVVFTGRIEGYTEKQLTKIAFDLGARAVKGYVRSSEIDVLVRGSSKQWSHGNFGNKEKLVADLQASGHPVRMIDAQGFLDLQLGLFAPTLIPHVLETPRRADASAGGSLGSPYREGSFSDPLEGDGKYVRDPDIMGRGLKAHSETQDSLARLLRNAGFTPLSPFGRQINFDLAWQGSANVAGIAEIKSITENNEAFQIRHGLGQILDYGYRAEERGFQAQLFLVLERKPAEASHWEGLCKDSSVTLSWGPDFPDIVEQFRTISLT